MIDLHAHVLPGIDDGPSDMPAALELLELARRRGTRAVAATPHIDHQHHVDVRELPGRLLALRDAVREAGIGVEVYGGGEISITRFPELSPVDRELLRLGGGSYLLLESPFTDPGTHLESILMQVQGSGFRVLLAHPERSPAFLGRLERLARLVEQGCAVQVTAGAMAGRFGRTAQDFAARLFERRLVHVVSSDAHDTTRRLPGVSEAFAALARRLPALEQHAEFFTERAPAAVIAGAAAPTPPEIARRRTFGLAR